MTALTEDRIAYGHMLNMIHSNHARIFNKQIRLTSAEMDQVYLLCNKRRARLEIKEPNDTAWSTLKVLDLGDNKAEIASTRMKLRHTWYQWCFLYPEGTDWRIRYDVF